MEFSAKIIETTSPRAWTVRCNPTTVDDLFYLFVASMTNLSNSLPLSLLFYSVVTNWSQLGAFRFEGTMADMVDLLNFDDVTSARDLFEQLSESDKLFCAKEIIVPTEKIPTTCVGPIVSLVLRPKTCVLNAVKKELVCDPAKLVLVKTPGECTFKHKSAFEYVGKQCRIVSTIGLSKDVVIGGGEFSIEFEKTKATVNTSSRLVDVAVE